MVTSVAALMKFASVEFMSLRDSATEMLVETESLSTKSTVYILHSHSNSKPHPLLINPLYPRFLVVFY